MNYNKLSKKELIKEVENLKSKLNSISSTSKPHIDKFVDFLKNNQFIIVFEINRNNNTTNIIDFNDNILKLLNISSKEMNKLSILQLLSPENTQVWENFTNYIISNNFFSLDTRLAISKDKFLPVRTNFYKIDSNNNIDTIFAVIEKIEILENNKKEMIFQCGFLNSEDKMILIIDKNNKIIFTNELTTVITEFSKEEILNNKLEFFLDKDTIQIIEKTKIDSENNSPYFESKIMCKNGKKIDVEVIIRKLSHTRDGVMIISFRDITDRISANKLLTREVKYNNIISHLSHSLIKFKSIDDVSQLILKKSKELTNSSKGILITFSRDDAILNKDKTCKIYQDNKKINIKSDIFTDWILQINSPIICNNIKNSVLKMIPFLSKDLNDIKNYIVVPAIDNNSVIGILILANSSEDYNFQILDILERITSIFILSMEKSRNYELLSKYKNELETMVRIRTSQFLKINEQLTKELKLKEEFQDELNKFKTAVEQSTVNISILDKNGKIEYINPEFIKSTGYKLEEVRGLPPSFMILEPKKCDLNNIIFQKNSKRTECTKVKKSGEIFWESSTISPILNSNGELTNFIVIGEDITKLKKMQERIIHTEKIAAIGELAASVAHELNNPLTIIHGYVEFISIKLGTASKYNKEFQLILNETKKSKKIIEGLLEFSTNKKLKKEFKNIGDIINKSIALISHHLKLNDIEIELSIPDSLPQIYGDMVSLQQVFVNLGNNSSQHIKNGGKIFIKAWNNEKNIFISFEDTGTGINQKFAKEIFLPFFSTREKGTGLGLSICSKIIENHDGKIELISGNNEPCKFLITLPVIDKKSFT